MGGGLMQLVAYGAQDVYLTGNPQITFFKVVYRRHTNFAIEAIEQTFNGNPAMGSKATVQITRNGDLVTKMYLKISFNENGTANTPFFQNGLEGLLTSVELQIGGTKIDKHYGRWLNVWRSLTISQSKRVGYDNMIGNVNDGGTSSSGAANKGGVLTNTTQTYFLPLQFFCCRNDCQILEKL